MTRRRAPRPRTRDESGFTLTEMIIVIIILGIVAVPISAALIQALQIMPSASARTSSATNDTSMVNTFSADIAQANTQAYPSNGAVYNWAATKWDLANADANGQTTASKTCQTSGTAYLAWIFWKEAKLSQDSTTPSTKSAAWALVFNTPTGAAYTTVSVQRLFTGDTAWTTVMTGYCTGTEKVATVTTTLAGYTESSGIVTTHEDVNMTLTLHPDAFGSPANTISMDAQVRAS